MVDSSVWVAWLRGTASEPVAKLAGLAQVASLLLGDLVLLELLRGARDDRHAGAIEGRLIRFRRIDMVRGELAIAAARNYRLLRSRGITIRKTIDLLIGTWCIANAVALLHDDRDFEPMRQHLGLLVA
jgi:predicted nucleic acid-binding protein